MTHTIPLNTPMSLSYNTRSVRRASGFVLVAKPSMWIPGHHRQGPAGVRATPKVRK